MSTGRTRAVPKPARDNTLAGGLAILDQEMGPADAGNGEDAAAFQADAGSAARASPNRASAPGWSGRSMLTSCMRRL